MKPFIKMSHWFLQEIHIFPRERYFGKEIGKTCCFFVGFKSILCLCRKAVGKTSEKILALTLCLSNKIFFRYFWARAAIYITRKGPPTSERSFAGGGRFRECFSLDNGVPQAYGPSSFGNVCVTHTHTHIHTRTHTHTAWYGPTERPPLPK
jgi:hypothetical protein